MDKDLKSNLQILTVLGVPLIALLLYTLLSNEKKDKILSKEGVHTWAIITKRSILKGGGGLNYKFIINKKIYKGYTSYNRGIQNVRVGDICKITYAKSDPNINTGVYTKINGNRYLILKEKNNP